MGTTSLGADLEDLVRAQLKPHMEGDLRRISISGPRVNLAPGLATPFGLVIHELATNAAKYGALSVETGHVSLTWELLAGNEGQRLAVVWKEENGPPVKEPTRRGFGGTLIEGGIPGATAHRDFTVGGVVCTIEADLGRRGMDRTNTSRHKS